MIPKIIHYCWIIKDPIPKDMQMFIDGWYEKLPDYEFMLWDFNRFDIHSSQWVKDEGGNLAASKIRNLECPNYEICLIDYGCGKFNRKIHIMEQYP